MRLLEALGRLVGATFELTKSTADLVRQRDQALIALERAGCAVVITDPTADSEPYINDAARRLLAEVMDGEHVLHRLIARPYAARDFARHIDVELVDGGTGLLRGRCSQTGGEHGTLITVLDLQMTGPRSRPRR